ncbi:VWA domain-containing protein [Aliidiomarina quisquiliarum]|uniref:VWA domain-containing protein n=1 Tax=Aliidiomarina quisquiliarum TaxID=2938947 RepID=UPI00208F4090|nr:VWA domain-containing protein [Aliidiomarina quisquiliarum]MCO4320017.1 VWA domain-containing protein [Aliidiomarina quisquiliarum]
MNAQKMKRLAKVLAPLLGGKNCEVTIGGQQAYTNGDRINIPSGDFSDPDFVAMAHGYIDHELGHNAFTNFSVSQSARAECSVLNKLRNALEDVRMERLQGEAWRGAKINLNKLASMCVEKGHFPSIEDLANPTPTEQVLFFCLYWGRLNINQQYALGPLADSAEANLREQLGDQLVDAILSELAKLATAKSNQDCLDIARAILKLLKDEAEDNSDNEPEGEESDESEGSEETSEDESSGNTGDSDDDAEEDQESGSEGNSDDETSGNTGDSDDDSDDTGGEPGDNSSDDAEGDSEDSNEESDETASSKPSSGENGNETAKQFIKALLEAGDDDDVKDIHEIIANELGEMAEEAAKEDRVTDLGGFNTQLREVLKCPTELEIDSVASKSIGKRVYKTIRRALIDSSMNQRVFAQTGKRVAKRRLAGVPAGSQSVFERRFIKPEPTAAVSILVDASGSMQGDRQEVVGNVAYAIAYGLNAGNIMNQTTFYGVGVGHENVLYRAKRFGDKQVVAQRFSAIAHGSTPTGEAMQAEILELINRNEDKKFLFVLTDGVPDSIGPVIAAIKAAKTCGIRVIPIGIQTNAVRGFGDLSFQRVNDLSDLDGAIKHSLSEGLLA